MDAAAFKMDQFMSASIPPVSNFEPDESRETTPNESGETTPAATPRDEPFEEVTVPEVSPPTPPPEPETPNPFENLATTPSTNDQETSGNKSFFTFRYKVRSKKRTFLSLLFGVSGHI